MRVSFAISAAIVAAFLRRTITTRMSTLLHCFSHIASGRFDAIPLPWLRSPSETVRFAAGSTNWVTPK